MGLHHGEPLSRRHLCRRHRRCHPPGLQHREGEGSKHVRDFDKRRLVYVEHHATIEGAIAREKLVKKWRREWKFALIEADNPEWDDLWEQWFAPEAPQR